MDEVAENDSESVFDILSKYSKLTSDIEQDLKYSTSKLREASLAACSATKALLEYRFHVLQLQHNEVSNKEKAIIQNYIPVFYNGSNYIENMLHDTDFLAGSVEMVSGSVPTMILRTLNCDTTHSGTTIENTNVEANRQSANASYYSKAKL
eukprot:gb/GECG01006948.1/.p1 GENE.gb/GECG01006948.1/~~gb/GECG01006948.1/.p1  ORF type:complete len:151 (+),score=19.82 gb/GECG01006948.1/:1-453(+)